MPNAHNQTHAGSYLIGLENTDRTDPYTSATVTVHEMLRNNGTM